MPEGLCATGVDFGHFTTISKLFVSALDTHSMLCAGRTHENSKNISTPLMAHKACLHPLHTN